MLKGVVKSTRDTDTETVLSQDEFASNLSDVIMLLKTHPDLLTSINTIPVMKSDLIKYAGKKFFF